MAAAWQRLRGWLACVGSDPYYASYERSLGNIKAELDRIQASRTARQRAWAAVRARFLGAFAAAYAAILSYTAYVNHQPQGTYRPAQQAARVAPAFGAPLLGWLAHRALGWLQAALDRRAARRVAQLEGKLRKQVAELKDSTRYDRTLQLLQKYDPDYAPPKPPRSPSGRQAWGKAAAPGSDGGGAPPAVSRAAGAAVNAAGAVLQGAGARMFPVLAQLYSRAADTLIADDPVMLGLLGEAQQQSDLLRRRLLEAEGRSLGLLAENIQLKQRLGLPTGEEEAALAAWTGGGGAEQGQPGRPEAAQEPAAQRPAALAGPPAAGDEAAAPAPAGDGRRAAAEGSPAGGGSGSRATRRKRGSQG